MATATDVDRLFQLPLGEFTAARNALAARLKKAGRHEEAERVKSLLKPPISAWAVNQLYWRHRKGFDRLMAAGDRFRKAQAAQFAGKSADIRAPFEERRKAAADLTKLAAGVLRDAGHSASPDTLRRITTTLEALATYGAQPDAPAAGRLTDDVDAPGFEALAALVPREGHRDRDEAPPRIIPFTKARKSRAARHPADPEAARRERMAAATAAVRAAETELKEARKAAAAAEAALKQAAAHAKEKEKLKAEIEARYEAASAEAEQARHDARRVASDAEEAAQAVDDAELALEKARRELRELS